jgi:hypothetical protein
MDDFSSPQSFNIESYHEGVLVIPPIASADFVLVLSSPVAGNLTVP